MKWRADSENSENSALDTIIVTHKIYEKKYFLIGLTLLLRIEQLNNLLVYQGIRYTWYTGIPGTWYLVWYIYIYIYQVYWYTWYCIFTLSSSTTCISLLQESLNTTPQPIHSFYKGDQTSNEHLQSPHQ
jgi:hypothetical protein